MRRQALEHLTCLACGGPLSVARVDSEDSEHIEEGVLVSEGCGRRYVVTRGVPRLTPDDVEAETRTTVGRFGEQWAEFRTMDALYEQQFLGWIRPNGPDAFEGKVVLEAGCGKGRHSILAARWGAREVIATDLGSAVDTAYANTRHLPNVHVVQADVRKLPCRPRSFDVGFSVGVLHHVLDPHEAFRALESRVREGGRVIAWVYGRENNGWIVNGVNPVRERLTSRLPSSTMLSLSRVPAAVVWAASRFFYRPLSRAPFDLVGSRLFYQSYMNQLADFPFNEIHAIVHDHLTPPIAHYISGEEFKRWFDEAGLRNVVIGWHNEMSWRGTGVVPAA